MPGVVTGDGAERGAEPGVEHLVVLPDRDVADEVAEQLVAEGLAEVRVVREALAGEDDAEDHEWAVYVRTPEDPAWTARLEQVAADHDGWYDADPHTR